MLSGGRRRGRERQRTLEATLDWSYDLLDDIEQSALASLGVFRGPFDADAAAAVMERDLPDTLELLESLIAESLLSKIPAPEATVYRLLETLRAYAETQLQRNRTLEAHRDRHLDHFTRAVRTTDEAEVDSPGPDWHRAPSRRWLQLKSNLDAAIDWAIVNQRYISSSATRMPPSGRSSTSHATQPSAGFPKSPTPPWSGWPPWSTTAATMPGRARSS